MCVEWAARTITQHARTAVKNNGACMGFQGIPTKKNSALGSAPVRQQTQQPPTGQGTKQHRNREPDASKARNPKRPRARRDPDRKRTSNKGQEKQTGAASRDRAEARHQFHFSPFGRSGLWVGALRGELPRVF